MKHTRLFLAAAFAGALLAGGCSEDGDTIYITNTTAATPVGNLPADPYTSAVFSSDKQAFNELNAGLTFDGESQPGGIRLDQSGVRCFWNNGKAIVMFATESDNGEQIFWASYYNGSSLTPPAQILAADQDVQDGADVQRDVRVAWFNTGAFVGTTGAATNAGRARNGDALILWHRQDVDDAANNNDESNDNLYMTYFDVSQSGSASANYGFDKWALQVNDGSDTTTNSGTDDVRRVFGFVTDGLVGETFYDDGAEGDTYRFGDAVSFLVIAYLQDVETTASGGGDISDTQLLTKVVNIGNTTDTANSRATLLGSETRVLPPADAAEFVAGGGTNGNEETSVNPSLRVYNGEIFYTISDQNNAGGASVDTPLLWNQFTPGSGFLANSLRVTGTDDNPTDTNASGLVQFGNIFGADEGLASTFSSFAAGGSGGTDDTDAFILQSPPAGAAFGAADLVEIDNELDAVGDNDPVTFMGSAISRDGSWIVTAFQQDDTSGVVDSVAVVFGSAFQPVAAGGTRVNMNAASVPFTATPTKLSNLSAGDSIIDFNINEESGYRGIQSNRLVFSGWALIDPTGGVDEAILHWTATVTLGTATATPSLASNGGVAVAGATFDTLLVNGNHSIGVDPTGSNRQIQSWDDGNGGSIIVWVQETATTAGNGTNYYEVMINDGASTQAFSLDDDELREVYLEGGTTLPKQPSVTGSNASYGGDTLHLFINVPAFGGGANTNAWRAVRHRSWNKNATAGTFASQWSPALTAQAALVSDTLETVDATFTGPGGQALGFKAEKRHLVWNGSSLGVFFATVPDTAELDGGTSSSSPRTSEVWYAEWNNGSWGAPTLANDHPVMRHVHGFDVAWPDHSDYNTRTGAIMSITTDVGGYDSNDHSRALLRRLR
ncbi:MAG: autotransporter outer membrane beta-barrel domain-containing protein [Planctomycetota bacterium]|jgi:hypothetical protein